MSELCRVKWQAGAKQTMAVTTLTVTNEFGHEKQLQGKHAGVF